MRRYNPKEIEPKWQKIWDKNQTYRADLGSSKPKYYAMSMLNYPSGSGIHIGHAMNYTISDVMARAKRQQGFESYHPVGWDAFGLPAENYAIKSGVSPQQSMADIIPNYHKQYKAMGWSNDWSKEVSTHDPEYYKWTQWIFAQMYKHGLAYQDSRLQWWCPIDNTVLADEQVTADGKCWRHDGPDDPLVERREVKQWFFKITDYADELLDAIDELDWSESVKLAQKNWIGKSAGALIDFEVEGQDEKIQVFTTRPDTIYGATYIVLAPEHPLAQKLLTGDRKGEGENYIKQAARKTDVERQEGDKAKTGVPTGSHAINPANGEKIPIWIADYVIMAYGTGAIMAVPGHDQRDHDFACKYSLPIRFVVEPTFGEAQGDDVQSEKIFVALRNLKNQTVVVLDWGPRQKNYGGHMMIGGSVEDGEEHREAAEREIKEETGYKNFKFVREAEFKGHGYFYSNTKNINVHASGKGMLYDLIDDEQEATNLDHGEKDKFKVTWQPIDKVGAMLDDGVHEAMYRYLVLGEVYSGEGVMINSGKYDGMSSSEARERIVKDLSGMDSPVPARVEYIHNRETGEDEPVFIDLSKQSKPRDDQPYVERQAITALVKHWKEDKYIGLKWKKVDWETIITGGIEDGQTAEEAAIAEIREETGYQNPVLKKHFPRMHAKFYHNPKGVNRFAHFTCMYFELADDEHVEVDDEEKANHEVLWLSPEEMDKFKLPDSQWYMWNLFRGRPSVAREAVNYRMRDWSVSRQRYWGAPIPIIHCPKCGPQLVPEDQLPVLLPELKDFAPSGDGRSALARATDWLHAPCPNCGETGERETDTLDTYICSSWYFLRYLDPANAEEAFSSQVANKWMPVDFYNGADHATAHMIYARFVTRFFARLGLLDDPEPFKRFLFNGKVVGSDGKMFSKSKGNGVDPLEIIDSGYGADALRTYLMFAAPLDQWIRWDPQGVPGTFRFLSRIWNLTQEFLESAETKAGNNERVMRIISRAAKKVTADIESQKYNTAIAAMMQSTNELYAEKAEHGFVGKDDWQKALEALVQLVAPFAPHIAEELWHDLGHEDSVHVDHWPEWDEKLVAAENLRLAVQVNGKVRAQIEMPANSSEAEIIAKAKEAVASHLDSQAVQKEIYVPGRLVSLVV